MVTITWVGADPGGVILPDVVVFAIVALFALIFSIEAFDIPTHGILSIDGETPGDKEELVTILRVGRLFAQIRVPAFFLIAGVLWMALGVMFGSANNCDFTFQSCYTSPLYTNTTATVNVFTYGLPLEFLFFGVGTFFVILFIVAIIGWFMAWLSQRGKPVPFQS